MSARTISFGSLLLLALAVTPLWAELPTAPKLLPERTVALVRIRDFPDSRKKFGETAGGRILSDPEVGPLVSKIYEQAQEAYARVEEQVGVPLDKLLSLPQGEAWLAVVPSAHEGPVSLAVLIEVGDQLPTATKLLERGQKAFEDNGGRKIEQTIAGTKVNVFLPGGAGEPREETKKDSDGKEYRETVVDQGTIVQFEKEGAIVIATTATLTEEILNAWGGNEVATLSGNERFAAIMNRCQPGKDAPGFEWYVDPISAAKGIARGNPAAQFGLALIPALGLDGIQAVGGTMTFSTAEFDGVGHTHLLLENPKSGVLEVLQMSSGDATPESWVPHDAVTYMTLNWDFQESYAKGTKVYDGYYGEGSAAEAIRSRVKNALDIDFETELLPAMEGRVTLATWNQPPARLNSQANVVGIKLTDAKAFQETLDKIMAKYPERLEKKTFGSNTYHQLSTPNRRQPEEPDSLRVPEPCFAIVGDYLMITDSVMLFERCITTMSTGKSLANEIDYKLIASKIKSQVGAQKPGFVIFSRPEEGLRMLYELAMSDSTKRNLARGAENNELLRRLDDTLKSQPLPPFPVIAKYLAPSGAMVTQDETGFHYMSFTLKRK